MANTRSVRIGDTVQFTSSYSAHVFRAVVTGFDAKRAIAFVIEKGREKSRPVRVQRLRLAPYERLGCSRVTV